MQALQSREFEIRAQVQPAVDILRSATVIGAQLVRLEGQIGVIAPGACADLLVVDGNPLDNIRLLARPAETLRVIMKAGRLYRDELT
jgi:imidazolonepropionase-like amidohydrolase